MAVDAGQRRTSCSFAVTVQSSLRAPRLSLTRIMAFGDSITFGVDGDNRTTSAARPYPTVLRNLLAARYYDQTIEVTNEGVPGEVTKDGLVRFPSVFARHRPEMVLLQEGANDLAQSGVSAAGPVSDNLRGMAKLARAQGAQVFIATLLPQRAGPPRSLDPALVPIANFDIRAAARFEGVPVIDLFVELGGSPNPFVGTDGLHPNQSGYQKIAEVFFDALRSRFETQPAFPMVTRR
jgi:lysophospholipase L1-like esterase